MSSYTNLERAREKYLEECASSCPHCGEHRGITRVRRLVDGAKVVTSDEARPQLRVQCYCAACGRGWFEVYRLEGVEFPGEGR